jgi:flagellar motility protein MotE (MotC chaperone)
MPEEEKKQEETKQDDTAPAASKKKGPILLIIIGVVVLVAGIGGFSMIMGVFSTPPEADEEKAAEKKTEKAAKSNAEKQQENLSDTELLEKELFGVDDLEDAKDMDDLVKLIDDQKSGMSEEDSIEAVNWLDAEKAKLLTERVELDKLKKEMDAQEYQLKQLIAKRNQMESTRIGALAKLYDGMKASQVAPLLTKLTDEQAVQILLKMKPANAAKILGSLSPDRAARISAKMITLSEE